VRALAACATVQTAPDIIYGRPQVLDNLLHIVGTSSACDDLVANAALCISEAAPYLDNFTLKPVPPLIGRFPLKPLPLL
jgi:hypothetical protein